MTKEEREEIEKKIEETKKNLELYEKRWENYSGNNPNKYKNTIDSLKKDLRYYTALLNIREKFQEYKER